VHEILAAYSYCTLRDTGDQIVSESRLASEFTGAEGAPAPARFISLLKAGGSDYPYPLYKKAGLDMATPAPYEALVARMSRIMDQIDGIKRDK
jgi:oligoendopeptidase F